MFNIEDVHSGKGKTFPCFLSLYAIKNFTHTFYRYTYVDKDHIRNTMEFLQFLFIFILF